VRLELQIALSLARPGRSSAFGPDPSQVGELHLPRRGPDPFPVAVLLHGGYWQTVYGKLVMRPLALDLVRRGWAAWNLEYRRLGTGRRGTGRGGGGGWPTTFADVADGLDHLDHLARLVAPLDLSDVSLVGHSAGGQLALWAARRPQLPEGAVGARPVVPATRVVALAPVTDLGRARVHAEALLGGGPAEQPERWAQADPVRAGAPAVPALVVHPRADATVPVQRSREYAAAARDRGGDVRLVEPATGGHRGVIDPSHPAWHAAADWLGRTA
jgi:acetyl esterase/lipase